jgi:hypothetical protein
MDERPETIRDANSANQCAHTASRRCGAFQSVFFFAVLVLLLCVPILRAQATLGTTTGDSNALAINSNNSPGLGYNAVLNSDSSVSLLQDGAIVSGQGCPAYTVSGAGITVSSGAIFVDFANSNLYLSFLANNMLYTAYESVNPSTGACTPGPLLQLTANAQSNLEMNVDPVQGNVYVLNSFGAFPDALYILPIAPWSASSLPTPTTLTMDYSAQYGPIVIDLSNDKVYVDDLGGSAYGTVGTYATSGFFVYDPKQSATPANNLQHVVGYNSGGTTTVLNVGTLLDNGAGKLILINENPNASTVNLTVPITILDTTQFSFFTNTTKPFTNSNDVDITPGAGLSTISATAQYEAISGADIDAVNQFVYAYAFNIPNSTQPGMLLEYNLSSTASPQETVLSSATAKPNLYGSLAPWSGLNYNPGSTELVLSAASEYGAGALGLTSPLCAGTPLTLTQLVGSAIAPTSLDYPVVNATSGYVYAIQSGGIDYVAPPPGCVAPTPIQISPATLYYGFAGESYFVNFTATGGSGAGYTWAVTSGTALSAVGLSLTSAGVISGYPNATETAAPFTVQVVDSQGNTASQNYTLTIYPTFSITPTTLPAGSVGTPYSQTFIASGGAGSPFTFSVASGMALSAVGLTLSSTGTISGTPNATETAAAFVLRVADSLGDFSQLNYTLTVNSAVGQPAQVTDNEIITVSDAETLPDVVDSESITVMDTENITTGPIITSASPLATGIEGVPYTVTLAASGGTPPYAWSATGQPAGLSINKSTGVIYGTPTAAGTFSVTVTVTDSANFSFSVPLSLTVAPPAPIASLNPTLLVFAPQAKGTTSPAQIVTLSNTGSAPLNITGTTGISISGANATDFSQISPSCGSSVAAGGNCAISVTFTPSSTGAEAATLNVADNASGTPQQAGLSGVALPPASASCTIPTVTFSGDMATAQITCTATDFTGSVALVCNLPTQPPQFSAYTCSFSPSSLNFATSNTASTTLTIQLAQSASLVRKSRPWAATTGGVAFGAVLWLPAWAFVMSRKKGRSKRGILFLLILFCGLPLVTSCGGKSGPPTPPAGTYQASVVLTGPGLNQTISFTIQVP